MSWFGDLMVRIGLWERDMVPTDADRRRWRRGGWRLGAIGVLTVTVAFLGVMTADSTAARWFGWVAVALGLVIIVSAVLIGSAGQRPR